MFLPQQMWYKVSVIKTLIVMLFINLSYADTSFKNWKNKFILSAQKYGLKKSFVSKEMKKTLYNKAIVNRSNNQVLSDNSIDYPKYIERWMKILLDAKYKVDCKVGRLKYISSIITH